MEAPLSEILIEIDRPYKSIKEPFDRTPEGLINELDYRSQWLARSAELFADAQRHLDVKRGQESERCFAQAIPASTARDIIAGNSSMENKVFTLAERLNATLTHQIDALRSILSFEKQGMALAGKTEGQRLPAPIRKDEFEVENLPAFDQLGLELENVSQKRSIQELSQWWNMSAEQIKQLSNEERQLLSKSFDGAMKLAKANQ